ncbi:hypothetical protein KY289_019413 [Solanum tuberosum]|nr:hypothetical protein KY289_019413 [Solanum tuberosum]
MAEEKEIRNLFNQILEGKRSFDELDARKCRRLLELVADIRTKLDKRKRQLIEHGDKNVANETSANDNNAREENDGHPWDVD